MDTNKKVLIITDGAPLMVETAEQIAAIIGNSGYSIKTVQADQFSGTDLLPACAFFLGCEKSNLPSFMYIEDMLEHINLAGRFCGVFSSNNGALKYLAGLIRDSECTAGKPFLVKENAADRDKLGTWIQSILKA